MILIITELQGFLMQMLVFKLKLLIERVNLNQKLG